MNEQKPDPPLVSVIIPTYNRSKTVGRSITSVLLQTYRPVEIVVVDDGSTDETQAVLDCFGESIRVIRQANAGPSAARNRGVTESSGEIVAFLDSDDVWLPEKLASQICVLEQGGREICCCICNCDLEDAGGRRTTSFESSGLNGAPDYGVLRNPEEIMSSRFLLFNQVVAIRKAAFDSVGGFNESLWLLEDHHLALKLSVLGAWGVVARPLVVKYEETDSLGGAGRMDSVGHLLAVDRMFSLFLVENDPRIGGEMRRRVARKREQLGTLIRAHRRLESASILTSWFGAAQLFSKKVAASVKRRTLLNPRPEFVSLKLPSKGSD